MFNSMTNLKIQNSKNHCKLCVCESIKILVRMIRGIACWMYQHIDICRFLTMAEIRACDVPRSWRFLLCMGALCGCSNIYRFCWLPRWLRLSSVVYQILMLITYIIVTGVAMADHDTNSLDLAFNRYASFFCYIMMTLSNIVILVQTYLGSGIFVLFKTWKAFQKDNSSAIKHKRIRGAIIFTSGSIVIACKLTLIGIVSYLITNKWTSVAPYLFPILNGQTTRHLIFGAHLMIQASATTFICSYMLLCFVVLVDLTFLFRILREEMDGVFSVLMVDEAALERSLHRMHGICELVDAVNDTFGISLAIYLMWIVPNFINIGFQLVLGNEKIVAMFLPSFILAIVILILILVPPAVMTAQVKENSSLPKWEIFCTHHNETMMVMYASTITPERLHHLKT